MKLQNSSANSFFKRETFSPPQASSNKTISSAIPRNHSCYSPHKAARREGDETRTRFSCLKLRLYFSRLCRSRVMAGNFPARNPVNRRRRCGRSWADTFEREPVVGAEMGGHGEARLAGPDTAIYGAQGIGTVAQSFARLEFFQVCASYSALLPIPSGR